MAIVKVVFKDLEENGEITMLFGDSYKKWQEQFDEYIRLYKGKIRYLRAFKSNAKWKGFGGLKWCSEEAFQEELNDEPENPKRQYTSMRFIPFDLEGKIRVNY